MRRKSSLAYISTNSFLEIPRRYAHTYIHTHTHNEPGPVAGRWERKIVTTACFSWKTAYQTFRSSATSLACLSYSRKLTGFALGDMLATPRLQDEARRSAWARAGVERRHQRRVPLVGWIEWWNYTPETDKLPLSRNFCVAETFFRFFYFILLLFLFFLWCFSLGVPLQWERKRKHSGRQTKFFF